MKKLTIAEQIRNLASQALSSRYIADYLGKPISYVNRVLVQDRAQSRKQYTFEELSAMAQTLADNLYQVGAYAAHDVALELVGVLQRTPHAKIEQAGGSKSRQRRGS